MVEQITAKRFHEADGVQDWRALGFGVFAHYKTGSFAKGVALVDEIGRLADAANHHPDVDLRYGGLTIRLATHEVMGLTARDVALAQQISAAARALDIPAQPDAVQEIGLTLDARVTPEIRPFWRAVLGYREVGDEDVLDPHGRGPSVWFQPMDTAREQRSRLHVDVFVPHDQAEARVQAALTAGGRLVSDAHAPTWWTLADSEGNEVDVATWQGRD